MMLAAAHHPRSALCVVLLLLGVTPLQAAPAVEPAVRRGFTAADWLVLVAYVALMLWIGFRYSRRQTTTEEYFVASRKMSPLAAGISIFATMFSSLAFIGTPGEIAQHGPVLIALNVLPMPIIYLIVGYLVIPVIMRQRVTSAYELLEARLGMGVRLLGAGIFVVTRLVWMALMMYTTSFVIVTVMGWTPSWVLPVTILTGTVTTIYTLCGGFGAVVVTDIIQESIALMGAVFTVVYITYIMGGVAAWWPSHWQAHWAPQPVFSADPHVRVTMVGTVIGAVIWWACTAGSDQLAIQRYLSTRDAAAARRAFLHNCTAKIVVTSFLGILGFAVLGYYQRNPSALPPHIAPARNGDALFPHFVSHFLPAGLPGLVISGLVAAAMSSLSSGINSTITVIVKDFVATFWPTAAQAEGEKVRLARWLALAIGVIAIAGSGLTQLVSGNLLEVAGKTLNLFLCPMFGLFFLALFVPFGTPFGAVMSAIYSFVAALLIGYWDVFTGQPRISFQWIAPVSLVVSLSTGLLFSLLPTRGRPRRIIWAYAFVSAAPLIGTIYTVVR